MANMVKLMYSGSIFITYALSSYVAIEIIWINALKPKFEDTKKKTPALYILRILVALLTCKILLIFNLPKILNFSCTYVYFT